MRAQDIRKNAGTSSVGDLCVNHIADVEELKCKMDTISVWDFRAPCWLSTHRVNVAQLR